MIANLKLQHTKKNFIYQSRKIILFGFTIYDLYVCHSRIRQQIQYKTTWELSKQTYRLDIIYYQLNITPSKIGIITHFKNILYTISTPRMIGCNQIIIKIVNPFIWNWCNYFRYYNCQRRFRLRQYVTLSLWIRFRRLKIIAFCGLFHISYFAHQKTKNHNNILRRIWSRPIKLIYKILLHIEFNPKVFIHSQKRTSIFSANLSYWNNRIVAARNISILIRSL
jgi:hypothetical protein